MVSFRKTLPKAIAWSRAKLTPTKSSESSSPNREINTKPTSSYYQVTSSKSFTNTEEDEESTGHNETDHFSEDFHSLTPPISRNGHYSSIRSRSRSNTPLILNTSYRGNCNAKTRAGTPCKLSSLPGRDFCYRHQTGDSVMS